eukprot:20643-Eustigmatos_ZCMA.PRE.1
MKNPRTTEHRAKLKRNRFLLVHGRAGCCIGDRGVSQESVRCGVRISSGQTLTERRIDLWHQRHRIHLPTCAWGFPRDLDLLDVLAKAVRRTGEVCKT